MQITVDFSAISGISSQSAGSTLSLNGQDGSAPGTLTSFVISETGVINGVFDNGVIRVLVQVTLARFSNPQGLLENGGGKNQGIRFHAGEGVGTVTRPGLALAVGEPAINPGPRAMIEAVIEGLTKKYGHGQGGGQGGSVAVTIAIPGGEKLAEKTLNGRLGIEGGLSILGTTGIVIPYSCSSWIHSIHRGVDVARASGHGHLAAATGRTSEAAVQKVLGLPDVALIDMGDFAGGLLKYLRKNPVEKLTLAGGPGKIAKLAQGAMDLHSSKSRVHMGALADMLSSLGAEPRTVEAVKHAATAGEALAAAGARGLALGDTIARQAREVALATLAGDTEVEVMIFDRQGTLIGHGG